MQAADRSFKAGVSVSVGTHLVELHAQLQRVLSVLSLSARNLLLCGQKAKSPKWQEHLHLYSSPNLCLHSSIVLVDEQGTRE